LKEALYYKQVPVGKARCLLCPHRCMISNNKTGRCRVRQNINGTLYTKIYGQVSSYGLDPVEKKPLYHFYPGKRIFSIGSWGCNFKCTFCQNWQISQQEAHGEKFSVEDIAGIASDNGSIGIAYTYNEPLIWYEFVLDCAKAVRASGMKNVLVTNGFISEEPLTELLPYIDAMNIDLKAGSESFYREVCDGQLEPVMRTIKAAHAAGCHVELTTLLIPTLNDRMDEIREMAQWIASVSPHIPLHYSRYFPNYKMNIDPTPVDFMLAACEAASKELYHVYLGNVDTLVTGENTICPHCKSVIIERNYPDARITAMNGNKCANCGEEIYGKF